MERRNFAQVLKDAKVDIKREYNRLYVMFYHNDPNIEISFRDICEQNFNNLPFKGTSITLRDFDDFYDFRFEEHPRNFDINYLINFCEYVYNLAIYNNSGIPHMHFYGMGGGANSIITHIHKVIELVGYMEARDELVTIFVPKSQPAIVVSEMLPSDLSYKVIEYNHHSMKGDLARKQATLKLLADQLEAKKKELISLNKSLADDLFYLLNNMNIRHNNVDQESKSYKKGVADMPKDELEEWYDRTYDICLYAFMTLDQADRNSKVKELKAKIECNKE